MKHYFAFGGCLSSEVEFPDLAPTENREPDWEIRVSPMDSNGAGLLIGTHEVARGHPLRLYRLPSGLRLEYGRTGHFDVLSGGSLILWRPGSNPNPEVVRAILLGPVMALALQESGVLCLHGSAVAFQDRGVAFLAPKAAGKSTLALALMEAGGKLLSDDLVAIDRSEAPCVLPAVHSIRVRQDVTGLFRSRLWGDRKEGQKDTLMGFSANRVCWSRVPLGILYILDAVAPGSDVPAVARYPLSPASSAALVAQRAKLGYDLVGPEMTRITLEGVVALTRKVPVQRLTVVRDLAKLPEVVGCLLSWHGGRS